MSMAVLAQRSFIRSEIRHDSITQCVHQIIIGKYGFPSLNRYIHLIKKIINDLPYYCKSIEHEIYSNFISIG